MTTDHWLEFRPPFGGFQPQNRDKQVPSMCYKYIYTWRINMQPENDGLEDDFPFQLGDF